MCAPLPHLAKFGIVNHGAVLTTGPIRSRDLCSGMPFVLSAAFPKNVKLMTGPESVQSLVYTADQVCGDITLPSFLRAGFVVGAGWKRILVVLGRWGKCGRKVELCVMFPQKA